MQERINGFFKEYGELVKKWEVDFANYPMFIPDEKGGFRVIVQSTPIDIKDRPVKSPFIAEK